MQKFSKHSSIYFFNCLLLVFSINAYSQSDDLNIDQLLKMGVDSGSAVSQSSNEEFVSTTKNDFDNLARQIRLIDEETELRDFRRLAQQKRLELAIKLCYEDPNACFLIENYQNYIEDKEIKTEDDLEFFGLDIFAGFPLNFNQSDNTGVPSDYILRSGDILEIGIFGALENFFFNEVQINGSNQLILDGLGSYNVGGLNKQEAQNRLVQQLSNQLNAITNVTITVKSTAPIQVYSLGAVRNPGLYKLSAYASPLNGLIAAGGFKEFSSLRNIQLIRNEKLLQSIDLYNFLIEGKDFSDLNLLSGDVLQVGPVQSSISIFGEVNRPSKYEIKKNETLIDAINFALGLSTLADPNNVIIRSRNDLGQYVTKSFNVNDKVVLKDGDVIIVQPNSGDDLNFVELVGGIRNPGFYEFFEDMSLDDIIKRNTDLLNSSYKFFGIIKRLNKSSNTYSYHSFNLIDGNTLSETKLNQLDRVFIFEWDDIKFLNSLFITEHLTDDIFLRLVNLANSQDRLVIDMPDLASGDAGQEIFSNRDQSLLSGISQSDVSCLSQLKLHGSSSFQEKILGRTSSLKIKDKLVCTKIFNDNPEILPFLLDAATLIVGDVLNPGLYPIEGIIKGDLIYDFSSNINQIKKNNSTNIEWSSFNSQEIFEANLSSSLVIENPSFINLKNNFIPIERFITIVGEVKSPGVYTIKPNNTLSQIIERAGGYTNSAYPFGGILTRESLKQREKLELERASQEMKEIFSNAITSGTISQGASDVSALLGLISQTSNAEPVGRLVTEFSINKLKKDPSLDVYLENGDFIYIPSNSNTVSVVGSVLNPVTIPFSDNLSLSDYIQSAGGYKKQADPSKVYILLPNGMAVTPSRSFFVLNRNSITPGSTIVVPRDERPLSGFALFETLAPVLANLSITAASFK